MNVLAALVLWIHSMLLPPQPLWIPAKELTRLQRYHGVNGLKIDCCTVQMRRDGKWITVARIEDYY